MATTVTRTAMPDDGAGTQGVQQTLTAPQARRLAQIASIAQRLDAESTPGAGILHKLAAPIAAAVLDAFGKDEAAAALLRTTAQKVSDMRAGIRGMALWQLVALCAAKPGVFLAFDGMLCGHHGLVPAQERGRLTLDQLARLALEIMSGDMFPLLCLHALNRFGASESEVRAVLTGL